MAMKVAVPEGAQWYALTHCLTMLLASVQEL